MFLCHRKTRFLSYVLVRVCGQWKTLTRGTGTNINSDREHDDQQLTLRGHAGDARHIKAIQTNTDNDCEQGNHQLAFFYVPAGGARAGGVRSSPNFLKYVHVSDAKSTRCLLHACKLWKKCSAVHAVHVHASYARGVHRYTFWACERYSPLTVVGSLSDAGVDAGVIQYQLHFNVHVSDAKEGFTTGYPCVLV